MYMDMGMGMGGGVGVWRMVGRGRKEKDLMVGQISFYVFCCCVVRMDGFVQNRINEFVQQHLAFFTGFYDLATPPSQHVPFLGTYQLAGWYLSSNRLITLLSLLLKRKDHKLCRALYEVEVL